MTLSELIARVQRVFGDENEVVIERADVIRWANDGQLNIVRRTEYIAVDAFVVSVAGQAHYPLTNPRLLKISNVRWDSGAGAATKWLTPVSKSQYEMLNRNAGANFTDQLPRATPDVYWFTGYGINLFPAPDVAGKIITVGGVPYPAILVDGTQEVLDIPEYMHEDLVEYCLMRSKELDDDLSAATYYKDSYKERVGVSASDLDHPLTNSYPSVQDTDEW